MVRYVLVRNDAQTRTVRDQHPGSGKIYEEANWLLLRVRNPRLLEIARQQPTRAFIFPPLGRSVKHLPQRFLDVLQARGLVVEADDTILDLFVKLTGDEDFE